MTTDMWDGNYFSAREWLDVTGNRWGAIQRQMRLHMVIEIKSLFEDVFH